MSGTGSSNSTDMPEKKGITYREALEKARAACARKEHAAREMEEKIRSWGLNEEETVRVIGALRKDKFLDDQRYARAYTRDKFRFNKWGRVKIAHALRGKGIPAETISAALEEIGEDEYRELLLVEMQKKWRGLKGHPLSRKASLMRFARSRGYEHALIYEMIDRLTGDHPYELG